MKVLIAEDEYMESLALQHLISQYYSPEVEQVLLADNGMAAVETARKEKPDIIFMDIQMPLKNGIDASREIRLSDKNVKIIMLTAYSDFGYARESIQNDVLEYIVKPYSIKTFRETMDKAISEIHSMYREKVDVEISRKIITMLQREFIHKIMVNFRLKESIIEEYVQMLGIHSTNYRIILIRPDGQNHSKSTTWIQYANLLSNYNLPYMYSYFANGICIIAYSVNKENLYSPIDKLVSDISSKDIYVTSSVQVDWKKIAVVFYDTITNLNKMIGSGTADCPIVEMEEQLVESVLSRDVRQAQKISESLVHRAYLQYGTANDFGFYLIHVYHSLLRSIYATDEQTIEQLQQGLDANFSIPYCGDEDRAFKEFFGAVQKAIEYLTQNMQGKNWRLIRRVKKYIEENYSNSISLDEIAQYVSMSKFYLSRTFKTVEGESMKDYLQKIRIEKAKQLLLAGDNAASVTYKTGFSDPAYFSKCFKKVTGISPAGYQKQGQEK